MAGSRRRGWGAIRSRKVKGGVSYYASYRDPVDGSERVTAPHAFSSREDAEGWLAAERRLVESGSWVHPRERLERARREREAVEARAVSFGEFAERWLVRKVRDDKVKPRTRATYRHLLDRHLLPVFGGTPVRDITPDMVASWYGSLAGTPGARAGAYGLLKRVLASACEPPNPLLEFNPCRIRGGATLRSAERPVVGPVAVAAVAGRMPAEYRLAVSLAFWLSLRLGEVLALRRRDIDLERGVVHVTHALSYTKEDGFVDSTPKTEAGVRDIRIRDHTILLSTVNPDAYIVGLDLDSFQRKGSFLKRKCTPRPATPPVSRACASMICVIRATRGSPSTPTRPWPTCNGAEAGRRPPWRCTTCTATGNGCAGSPSRCPPRSPTAAMSWKPCAGRTAS